MTIVTIGIDLAKTVFAVHGVDATGKLGRDGLDGRPERRVTNGAPACVVHQGPQHGAASMSVCSFAIRTSCRRFNQPNAQGGVSLIPGQSLRDSTRVGRCLTFGTKPL